MNYETATDFELNFKLAKLLNMRPKRGRDDTVRLCGVKLVDYCTSWNDIMPIAVELNISIDLVGKGVSCAGRELNTMSYNKSPQRAIVICCIKVLEAQANEKK